jgi:signal transduction histidine kinase
VDALISSVRQLSTDLRPPVLDAGLGAAVQWQCETFQARTEIPCTTHIDADIPGLDADTTASLFRVFQELLTNVARHAHAQTVEVSLTRDDATCRLWVADDGCGFDAAGKANSGSESLGLLGVRERLAALDGHVDFRNRPGGGTIAEVTIPCQLT